MDNGRYSRQLIFKHIGEAGQEILKRSSTTIIGCGALGGIIANNLARAGIGHIRLADRDIVELNNLQRQMPFEEADVGRPKAEAAAEHLARINSTIEITPSAVHVAPGNIEELIDGCDLVIDATDNLETRLLINDACFKQGIPWVYGGAIETVGMSMSFIPGETACFRCLVDENPERYSQPTCDTVGVLNTMTTAIGALEATEALKIILGQPAGKGLVRFDIWHREFDIIPIEKNSECTCCVKNQFDYLDIGPELIVTPLCGSNTIQVMPVGQDIPPLERLAEQLQANAGIEMDGSVLKIKTGNYVMHIFEGGRTIIRGTEDEAEAKELFFKYVMRVGQT